MKTGIFLTSACSLGAAAHAWTTPATTTSASAASSSRRSFLDTAAKIVPLVLVASPAFAEDEESPAAVSAVSAEVVSAEVVSADAAAADAAAATPVVVDAAATEAAAAPESPPEISSNGEGNGDENEFIARLKARSEANKDKYKTMAERPDKLSKGQFLSQYDRPSYVGVHSPTNDSVTMVLKEDFEKLLSDGKVRKTYESKVNKKSGEISDDYSRPVFVYVN